jgi:C4-dicarboxylate-specific signal transduction histidine kinase
LLGPMAHELNNHVQGLSSAEYLFRDCLENGDPIEMEDVDQLAEAVMALKGMGAQLQGFARIAFNEPEAVSLPRIVTRAAKFLSSLGRMGIVEFTNEVPDDLPDAYWRAAELDFVVLALLANAVDASLVGGQDPQVAAKASASENAIELVIRNSGPALDLLTHAQPGVTTKESNRHLGVGLSTAMAVVAKRGGSVSQAEGGEGTVLRLSLPLRAKAEDAPSDQRPL